ncbi:MAG: AraC family transcriptional regulator ligand-binding domain-containing protein [Mycobacterium sp.]
MSRQSRGIRAMNMIVADIHVSVSAIHMVEAAARARIGQMVATRYPAGIRHAVTVARRAGIPIRRLLAGTGLSEDELLAVGYVIDQDAEFAMTANLVRELGNPVRAGIDVGSLMTVGDLGIWGYALITSATGNEAVAVALAYISLSPTLFRPQHIRSGDEVVVVLRDEHLPVDVRDFYAGRDLSALPLLMRTAGLEAARLTVDTRFVGAAGDELSAALTPIQVEFGAPQHRIRLPADGLDFALPSADAVTRDACARECERLVHDRTQGSTLRATIRSRFAKTPGAIPSIEELAGELHMSTRTLRRQLDQEHTSYRELRTDVSKTLAVELLSVVGLSVTEVARRLGYSDTTSFSHAFRRWTGRAASEYRSPRQ